MQQQPLRQERVLTGFKDEPLWLVVQFTEGGHLFELPTNADYPLAFGSSGGADVQLPSTLPFAFFLERDTRGVWIVPANPTAVLEVNRRKITTRTRIFDCTIVSVCGIGMVLWIRDSPPTLRAKNDGSKPRAPLSRLQSSGMARAESENAFPPAPIHSSIRPIRERSTDGSGLGDEDSIDLDDWCSSGESWSEFVDGAGTPPCDVTSLSRRANQQNPEQSQERPYDCRYDASIELEQFNSKLSARQFWHQRPLTRSLAQLGILTKRRPLGVFGSAALGSIVLFFFFVGAAQLLHPHANHRQVEGQSTVTSST